MRQRLVGTLVLMLAGCATPMRPTSAPPLPARPPGTATVQELASAIAEDARLSEHESDLKRRATLAADASDDAAACLARAPQAAACLYGHALALGLEARAHPLKAADLLHTMLDSLIAAEAADPNYDQAGPARVAALVLIRAPGWPLGPGNTDDGLMAARRAVGLAPSYPPNLLALGEALAKSGDAAGARDSYERARTSAQSLPPGAERDAWLHTAEEGLRAQ